MGPEAGSPVDSQLNAALKYNPHLWGPEELKAIFVVRQNDLEQLLKAIDETALDQVPQHLLITGQRGMGKTTLLRRLAIALAEDPRLGARWLPLTFPEEQYTVRTLAELWRNVLDALTDALEREGAEAAELARLDNQIERLGALPMPQREEAALATLTEWIASHGRGLVLLIDSSDLLLGTLAEGESGTASKGAGGTPLWRLRKTLSHQPGLFWIGASYEALESRSQYQDAFHDFFALHELRSLKIEEMRAALLALARRFGAGRGLAGEAAEQEMTRQLDAHPERIAVLRTLSGGNPRTTVMLYELFATGGEESVQADLKRLLDWMTPLYKARMEALSDQARKLFAHLLDHWHPVGLRELEAASGIPTTTISGQLNRLEAEGLVEKTKLAGKGKRAGYQASERFFNIWYLMRYGSRRVRQRLTWLVEFMRLWCGRDEFGKIAARRAMSHREGDSQSAAQTSALEPTSPYFIANLARLEVERSHRNAASEYFRSVVERADPAEDKHLLLQAHLWLGNRDSAMQALDVLAEAASGGDHHAFSRLREQAVECSALGLGAALAELMSASLWAPFLQPFILALEAATGAGSVVGAAPEVLAVAEEIRLEISHLGD